LGSFSPERKVNKSGLGLQNSEDDEVSSKAFKTQILSFDELKERRKKRKNKFVQQISVDEKMDNEDADG
jgi:hypothetical protein